ncbi:hypothetical protein [Catellatospora vulcania]|uniref:hypothetical protein n=1 Tax=Catellatospora vulcania TaxID=1460450 RepID=UPI0012D3747C|nr:hypothetical protein [Catellatospora vulcania]
MGRSANHGGGALLVRTRLRVSAGAETRAGAAGRCDASHELRTPLALQHTLAEVALADPRADAEAMRGVLQRMLAEHHARELRWLHSLSADLGR